jgi:hypothetical protein
MEQERLKEAKHNINLRYMSIPKKTEEDNMAYLQHLYNMHPPKQEVRHVNEVHHHHHSQPACQCYECQTGNKMVPFSMPDCNCVECTGH